MFPPDSEPVRRARTVGRRGRPLSLVVAILLFAAFWTCSAGMALWGVTHDRRGGHGDDIGAVVFWTLVFVLLAWRLWRGGRVAISFMARIGTMLGVLFLFGAVAFTVLFLVEPVGGSGLGFLPYLLPEIAAGAALLTGGLLLRRHEVTRWARS